MIRSAAVPFILFLFSAALTLPAQEAGPEDGTGEETTEGGAGEEAVNGGGSGAEETGEFETLDDMFADPFSDTDDVGDEESLSEEMLLDPFGDDEAGNENSPPEESDDYDSMFEEDMVEELDTETQNTSPEDDLLVEEGVGWGGSFSGSLGGEWTWDTVATGDFDIEDPLEENLLPSLGANLFFDARPDKDFRVFGKFKIEVSDDGDGGVTGLESIGIGAVDDSTLPEGWTAEENEEGDTEIRNEEGVLLTTIAADDTEEEGDSDEEEEEEPQTGTPPVLELNVFELFSDFTWKDRLFFRFGKHTIKWGTGYFWSPADVLNLTAIDVEDPTADREGPVSLRVHFPFSYHNAYMYFIANADAKPFEIALAPKAEFLIGNTEIGIGGYYQQALAPRIITTFAASLSDFDFFGEGVMSYGSDRVFIRESRDQSAAEEDDEDNFDVVLDTYEVETRPFFQFTAGTRYIKSFSEERGSLAVIGQYWFNGEGYANNDLLRPGYYLALNPNTNGLLIQDEEDQPEGYEDPPALNLSDLANFGRHYAALTVNWEIFQTDVNFTLLALANLQDWSGLFVPAISWQVFDFMSVSANARFTFGDPGDEYTNQQALFPGNEDMEGSTLTIGVNFSLGSGQF